MIRPGGTMAGTKRRADPVPGGRSGRARRRGRGLLGVIAVLLLTLRPGVVPAGVRAIGDVIDVALDHIEVVQVIQDSADTVPLVAGKATVARVFLRVNAPVTVPNLPVTVELSGLRDGSAAQPRLNAINRVVTIRPVPERHSAQESIAFRLPAAWTAAGPLTVQANVSVRDPWVELVPADNTAT